MSGFPSTQWSLIRKVGIDDSQQRVVWQELAVRYRPAIRRYLGWALGSKDVDDHVQEFLLLSIRDDWWSRADPGRGHFRGFLKMLLDRYVGHARSARRVRSVTSTQAEFDHVENRGKEADDLYDHAFVTNLTLRALERLQTEHAERGRLDHFLALKALLFDSEHGDHKRTAEELGMSANALAAALVRLRRGLARAMRLELAMLLGDENDLEREWQALADALRASSFTDSP